MEESVRELVQTGARLLRQGQHVQALAPLENALLQDPTNFDAKLNISAAYILNKKFKKAIPILEELLMEDDQNIMLWTNLGAAYLGNPILADDAMQGKAILAFLNALKVDPTTPNAAYNIGLIHKDRKEIEQAKQWFGIAIETNPDDQDAKMWLEMLDSIEEDSTTTED